MKRSLEGLNVAGFLLGVVTIAVVANYFAARPWLRLRLDATKTRAYSLSDQTKRLLEELDGEWTIALVGGGDSVEPAVLRQVTEVLDRYREASSRISVVRVDPADPETLDEYEAILSRLQVIYGRSIDEYEIALGRGREVAASFAVFLQQETGALSSLRRRLAAEDPLRGEIDQILGALGIRLQQAARVDEEQKRVLRIDVSRPLPEYDVARSILAATLAGWAAELYQIVQMLGTWRERDGLDEVVRQFASQRRVEYEAWAEKLAIAADPLKHLPPLELASIGRSLEQGEAAIVIGPGAARVIGAAQLFPRLNLRRRHSGEVAFDQRFRGEQTISAAIRSLLVEQMPMVVFVHGQDESLLRRRNAKVDLLGAVSMLEASRFEVREWVVHTSEPPTPAIGQPVVWIVIPPPVAERRTIEVTDTEQALLEAVEELIAGGDPVWLNLVPSVLPKMGHDDPWQRLAMPLGLKVDTARVVFEQVRDQAGEPINQRIQEIVDFEPEHPIARAADGLRATFDLPVAVEPLETPAHLHHTILAAIEARPNRWLESEWMLNPAMLDEPADADRFDRPLPIAIAVERLDPMGAGGQQRLIVVGSGGWLLSYVADLVVSIGGERAVLLNPGNYELLLAGVAWLAGADTLIAASPVSRQVARLDGITPAVRTRWRWIAMAGLPAACLLLGVIVWLVRRT